MSKTYKGYELMKMLSKGEINLKQKVNTLSSDYKNCTIDFVIKDRAENIIDLDFELIEDEINIQEIEEIKIGTICDTRDLIINKLVKAVKQLDKKVKITYIEYEDIDIIEKDINEAIKKARAEKSYRRKNNAK